MNKHTGLGILSITMLTPLVSLRGGSSMTLEEPSPDTTNPVQVSELSSPKSALWQDEVGNGFRSSVQDFAIESGVAAGMAAFGSRQPHDLALLSASYGHMLGNVLGGDHWYRGNLEARLELFGGMQYHPGEDTDGWLIGLTPHLRYNFATGTRWIPFLDGGAGVSATGIGGPDIGGTFEFNLQASTGVRWFFTDDMALTGEVRYMHLSCAGIDQPNLGLNNVVFMVGVTWFFGK